MIFDDYSDKLHGLYFGTVMDVIYPEDALNTAKYQTQYRVILTGELYNQFEARCVVTDKFGGDDEFEDVTLRRGVKVLVQFPLGDPSIGVITGTIRSAADSQSRSDGYYYKKRFNKITESIDKADVWTIEHDDGTMIRIESNRILIDDGDGNSILIEQGSKIKVMSGELDIEVADNAVINVSGNVTVKASNISVEGDDVSVKCKSLDANVSGSAKIDAKGSVDIKGSNIKLNGEMGQVITTMSQPVCYVSGIPFKGSTTVKAGS
jgi:phage baseplate assembly protein gpV